MQKACRRNAQQALKGARRVEEGSGWQPNAASAGYTLNKRNYMMTPQPMRAPELPVGWVV